MKKIISLQTMLLMSLAIGSSFTIDAYNNSMKYTNKSAKSCSKKSVASMNEIEERLHMIKVDFKESGDAACANKKLDKVAKELPCVIEKMKRSEEHIRLWKTHKHTLERQLRDVREFVNRKKLKNNK